MKIKRIFSYVFLLCVLLLGVSFAVLNAESVNVDFYLGKRTIPLSLLLVYTLGIGIFLGLLTPLISLLKLKKENHALKNTLAKTHSPSYTTPTPSP